MKALDKMNNVEKANLLHILFPDEIPAFLVFVLGVCQTIRENEQVERTKGEHAIVTFDFWLNLLNDAENRINRYGNKLHRNKGLFADQLFDGQSAMYMKYCLQLAVETKIHPNPKFTQAVRLLFETDKIH